MKILRNINSVFIVLTIFCLSFNSLSQTYSESGHFVLIENINVRNMTKYDSIFSRLINQEKKIEEDCYDIIVLQYLTTKEVFHIRVIDSQLRMSHYNMEIGDDRINQINNEAQTNHDYRYSLDSLKGYYQLTKIKESSQLGYSKQLRVYKNQELRAIVIMDDMPYKNCELPKFEITDSVIHMFCLFDN